MKYVLDASVGLKTVLPETDSDKAETLVREFQQQIHELIAPDTYLVECAHALTRTHRKGLLLPADAEAKFTLLSNTAPDLFPHIPLLARAFEISLQARIGVYDCIYAALAEREGCELVTADLRLITNLGTQFPIISLDSL
ncbi:MAG: PilT protein N-terminal [Schlesneria sp.]|nr:PilT protein N-terminal [Schlesneria sp.]